jgi:predicted dehydrogenase
MRSDLQMQSSQPVSVGIVGSGVISAAYLRTKFPQYRIVACADVVSAQAAKRAHEFGIEAMSPDQLLQHPGISVVLNLTPPQSHVEITRQALENGKHVYSEKPFAIRTEDAEPLLKLAAEKNLKIGCAPDTFLGAAGQTARQAIDQGKIGEPIGGTAFFFSGGPESWHPNPDFFYQEGAGPVFDMGPYYLTALVNLLGPVKRVRASGRTTVTRREVGSGPRQGEQFDVNVLTYVAALLDFVGGPIVTFIASFDVPDFTLPYIEIFGTKGALQLPDPNWFGRTAVRIGSNRSWTDVPSVHAYGDGNYRGIGMADLIASLQQGKPARASGELGFHVLEIMESIVSTAADGGERILRSRCERPRALQPQVPRVNFE